MYLKYNGFMLLLNVQWETILSSFKHIQSLYSTSSKPVCMLNLSCRRQTRDALHHTHRVVHKGRRQCD